MLDSWRSTSGDFEAQALVLAELASHAAEIEISLLVVGALARDLLVGDVTGVRPDRLTHDIDVAVAVDSWSDLKSLTDRLEPIGRSIHAFRLLGTEVDVVPFAGIEDANRSIIWPNEMQMRVLGMSEALENAVQVDLGAVVVPVASLASQVILKLLAWSDRHDTDPKDAVDLRTIMRAYGDEPYADDVPDTQLETYEFDVELAGADHLGSEAIGQLLAEDRTTVVDLVDRECGQDGLLPRQMGLDIARNRALLRALHSGMRRAQEG